MRCVFAHQFSVYGSNLLSYCNSRKKQDLTKQTNGELRIRFIHVVYSSKYKKTNISQATC